MFVLFFLFQIQGGGVCWNQETYDDQRCRRYSATANREGILDTKDQRSPFANYSVIVVHYCSSDFFLGDGTVSTIIDTTNQPIYYNGIGNTLAVLQYIAAQQAEGEFFTSTLESVLISGSSAGAIAAPLWIDQIISRVSSHSYVVIADSLVVNMPDSYQPAFFREWGFCGSILMPSEYSLDCSTRNFTHVDLHQLAMQKNPTVTFISITAKLDNAATASYNRYREDKGDPMVWPVEFYDVMLPVLERLNAEPNFVVYVITSINHLFLTRVRYFDATEYGDSANLATPVRGKQKDTTLLAKSCLVNHCSMFLCS